MTRIFEKKGVGMTDEQFLLVMFGKDIITKTATTIALKRQLTKTLELVYDQYQNQVSLCPPPPPPVTPPLLHPRNLLNSSATRAKSRQKNRGKSGRANDRKKGKKAKIVAPND